MSWWLAGGIVLAVFVVSVALWRGGRRRAGFRDWLRNPRLFYEQYARDEEIQNVKIPKDVSAEQIRAQVDKLLGDQHSKAAWHWLKNLGKPAVPALIAALEDERFTSSSKDTKPGMHSPLQRAIEILGGIGEKEVVKALIPFIEHENDEIRKTAALALGEIGCKGGVEALNTALHDEDRYVRSYVMIGVRRAMKAGRAEPELLQGLFESLTSLVSKTADTAAEQAVQILLQVDRDRALEVLLSDECLDAENPNLAAILGGLRSKDVRASLQKLVRLERELLPLAVKYPYDRSYAETLISLAAQEAPEIEEKIETALRSESSYCRNGAADALGTLHGIKNPMEFVFKLEETVGWEKMTKSQKHFSAVKMLEADVNNGGFSQYFFNSYSDHCTDALDGLEAVGASHTAKLLLRAMRCFGDHGPDPDRIKRQQRLSRMIDEHEKTLDELNTEFFEARDDLHVLLMQYIVKHASDFGGQAAHSE